MSRGGATEIDLSVCPTFPRWPAVRDDVKRDLFARHATGITVGEGERQRLRQRGLGQAVHVIDVPRVDCAHVETKLTERGSVLRVRSLEESAFFTQMGTEDAIDDATDLSTTR